MAAYAAPFGWPREAAPARRSGLGVHGRRRGLSQIRSDLRDVATLEVVEDALRGRRYAARS